MSHSRHYRHLSVAFLISALALFSFVIIQNAQPRSVAVFAESGLFYNCGPATPANDPTCVALCRSAHEQGRTWPGINCLRFYSPPLMVIPSRIPTPPPHSICGNGVVEEKEKCDDGNTTPGDGCTAKCAIEKGYACSGGTCVLLCGNGLKDSGESCDDGNQSAGDGCSANCKVIEKGFTCSGTTCTRKPVRGNGITEGSEACDLGNKNGPRGQSACSKTCQFNAA